ncbi:MAG: hypothetical protein WCA37_11610 [Terracidiphilus sp.]
MEADWEVEIGGDAPVLDAAWSGFIDLRQTHAEAHTLDEVKNFPPLGAVLVRLNSNRSPVWTAKCDFWQLDEFDPFELDAPLLPGQYALACYIDLFARNRAEWSSPQQAMDWCRALCLLLHQLPLRNSRADLVIRAAYLPGDEAGFGVTAYLIAVGADEPGARAQLTKALVAFADSIDALASR